MCGVSRYATVALHVLKHGRVDLVLVGDDLLALDADPVLGQEVAQGVTVDEVDRRGAVSCRFPLRVGGERARGDE